MSDDNSSDAETHKLEAEFADSVPVEKIWRYALTPDGTVHFGLLGLDGTNRHFVADPDAMSRIAAEAFELSRMSKFVAAGNNPALFRPSFLPITVPLDKDGKVAPFIGPIMKFDRANLHFEGLIDLIRRYAADTDIVAHEIGFEDPNVIWEIRFSQQPAAAIPLMIGDIVHNLRSALDLMICDLAHLQGLGIEEVKFPFAKDSETLEKILAKDHLKLGRDIVGAIRDLRPFKGDDGNKLLRGLHDLDVIDKHRLIIPTYLVAWQRHNMALRVADLIRAENPDREVPNIIYMEDDVASTTPMQNGDKIKCKRGEDPLRYYSKHERGVSIRFPMKHSPFAGEEVIPTLDALRQMVAEIVTIFRSKFNRANFNP